jgi:hypothetical protein
MVWSKILLLEVICITGVMFGLGFIKMPRFLMRRKLSNRFPWGYYADQVPKEDHTYSSHWTSCTILQLSSVAA